MAFAIIESVDTRHLIIRGCPGIGKTYFGYYLLLHLAQSGATVIYESSLQKSIHLLTPQGVFTGTHYDFREQLSSSSTFYNSLNLLMQRLSF